MLPQNFNPLMGQQGIPQQGLPQQTPLEHHPQQVPGVMNPENARAWQQLQQQQRQLQSQFRQPAMGMQNGGQAQNNQQVVDFIHSSTLARQQFQNAQQQQMFPIGGQLNGGPSNAAMLDPNSHNFQMQLLNKVNNPLQGFARNPAMLQGLQNQQSIDRQMELLVAGHSQNQSIPPNAASQAALRQYTQQQQQQAQQQAQQQQQQQQQQQHHHQQLQQQFNGGAGAQMSQLMQGGSLFGPEGLGMGAGPSNPFPNRGTPMPGNPLGQGQNTSGAARQLNVQVLRDRYNAINNSLRELEKNEILLPRSGKPEPVIRQEMENIRKEMTSRRQMLQKLGGMLTNFARQGGLGNQNPTNGLTMQNSPAAMGANGQPGNNWLASNAGSPSHQFAGQQLGGAGGQVAPNTPLQHNAQPAGGAVGMSAQSLLASQQPPRSGPTPLQHMQTPGPSGVHGSPNMSAAMGGGAGGVGSAQPPMGMNAQGQMQGPRPNTYPAMPGPAFQAAYAQYCQKHNIHHDEQLLQIEGKRIDLHRLHQEVIAHGTFERLQNNLDLWAVIGGRLDFIQFPGTRDEPPKSGPGVAQKLQHVYKEYLHVFDSMYLRSAFVKRQQPQPGQQQNGPPGQGPNQGAPGMNGVQPPGMAGPSNGGALTQQQQQQGAMGMQALAALTGANTQERLSQLITLSFMPVEELRRRNVPANVIEAIEANRPMLQRTAQQQRENFRDGVRNGQQNMPPKGPMFNPALNRQMGMPNGGTPGIQQQMGAGLNGAPGQPGMPAQRQPILRTQRPTPEEAARANELVISLRSRLLSRYQRIAMEGPFANVPEHQRAEYNNMLDQLYKYASAVEQKLTWCAHYLQEQVLKRMLEVTTQTQQQRNMVLAGGNMPKYIMGLDQVRQCLVVCANFHDNISKRFQPPESGQGQQHPQNQQPPHQPGPSPIPRQVVPGAASPSRPPLPIQPPQPPSQGLMPPQIHSQPHAPTPQPTQPSPRTQPLQTTPVPAPAVAKRKLPVSTDGAPSMSTPPASAATPASAPTPTNVAGSPQTPKSPKPKPQPKPKPRRRASVKGQPPVVPSPGGPSAATPATPVMDQSSPAASTPESVKRRREEDLSALAPSDAPSPKKQKTDWDGPVSEELTKKKQEVEAVKTDEDATKFFENITEMLAMATSDGHQVPAEISTTLDQILNTLDSDAPLSGLPDTAAGSSSSAPFLGDNDPFQFFDFSSYNEDDRGSKAPTPDLVQGSSTNPSPGSGSDTESHPSTALPDTARIVDAKVDEGADPSEGLRLGFWTEIDGGEAAYHNANYWKWDEPMPTHEQPWAITQR